VSAERFVTDFVARLRARAADLRAYGAEGPAQTCERAAQDLESDFRTWWLAGLSVSEAAEESGYSEDGLREMVRDGKLPAEKGAGAKGHLLIPRCHLPRRPPPPAATVSSIEERLLRRTARR
jgi:hypothetical protein